MTILIGKRGWGTKLVKMVQQTNMTYVRSFFYDEIIFTAYRYCIVCFIFSCLTWLKIDYLLYFCLLTRFRILHDFRFFSFSSPGTAYIASFMTSSNSLHSSCMLIWYVSVSSFSDIYGCNLKLFFHLSAAEN